ncbi:MULTISPECIES: hypothetical protein [Marinomonas]|uniref:Uncharacterized protein n=1 Tax=Marinomonas arctica TaxID=383750 RepID=A0A7H1J4V9_9GAMM|nr:MULTISPECIES: hypothetical protein [Marinomonas]MCS7487382.1 hypothetical protein [Marinomonas sp. BSi20414]QNT05525.1 hypothetical protein IBG28_17980 [Marinomonas arctica]GGN33084.1 hypothetical protein GCM10011350_28170 [Marinomonas arctica]
MSISPISNNRLYLPVPPAQTDSNVRSDVQRQQDSIQLSGKAKQQLISTLQQADNKEEKEQQGKESVQVSSSIGRLSRITGLQREEVAALYRSIDKLT